MSILLRTPDGRAVHIWRNWLDVGNSKARKGAARKALNGVHYMAPHNEAGGQSVCPWAARCALPCLTFSGHGQFSDTRAARIERTRLWHRDPASYLDRHRKAIGLDAGVGSGIIAWAERMGGWTPVVRLNGTSDIEYEKTGILHEADRAGATCLDYTKIAPRMLEWLSGKPLGRTNIRLGSRGAFKGLRYSLTFSLGGKVDLSPKEDASAFYTEVFDRGGNVAAVWNDDAPIGSLVEWFHVVDQKGDLVKEIRLGKPRRVIDGDVDDLRYLDPRGVVVGLSMKGQGIGDTRKLDRGRVKFAMNPGSRVAVVSGLPLGMLAEAAPPARGLSRPRSNPGLAHALLGKRLVDMKVGMPTSLAMLISKETGTSWRVWSRRKNGDLLNSLSSGVADALEEFLLRVGR